MICAGWLTLSFSRHFDAWRTRCRRVSKRLRNQRPPSSRTLGCARSSGARNYATSILPAARSPMKVWLHWRIANNCGLLPSLILRFAARELTRSSPFRFNPSSSRVRPWTYPTWISPHTLICGSCDSNRLTAERSYHLEVLRSWSTHISRPPMRKTLERLKWSIQILGICAGRGSGDNGRGTTKFALVSAHRNAVSGEHQRHQSRALRIGRFETRAASTCRSAVFRYRGRTAVGDSEPESRATQSDIHYGRSPRPATERTTQVENHTGARRPRILSAVQRSNLGMFVGNPTRMKTLAKDCERCSR